MVENIPKEISINYDNLQYLGNEIFIKDKRICIKPLRSRLEAIQKLQSPHYSKRMQKFHGNDAFSEYVLLRITKIIKTLYDLTRKGRPYVWGKEQHDSFEEINCRIIKPPVLQMPNTTGRFHLYLDTSKFVNGSAPYQKENSKPKLTAYASKRLPEAAKTILLLNYRYVDLP